MKESKLLILAVLIFTVYFELNKCLIFHKISNIFKLKFCIVNLLLIFALKFWSVKCWGKEKFQM